MRARPLRSPLGEAHRQRGWGGCIRVTAAVLRAPSGPRPARRPAAHVSDGDVVARRSRGGSGVALGASSLRQAASLGHELPAASSSRSSRGGLAANLRLQWAQRGYRRIRDPHIRGNRTQAPAARRTSATLASARCQPAARPRRTRRTAGLTRRFRCSLLHRVETHADPRMAIRQTVLLRQLEEPLSIREEWNVGRIRVEQIPAFETVGDIGL
jgi:hypothetical protein